MATLYHYTSSRAHRHVHASLGTIRYTLLSYCYEAYADYAAQSRDQMTHALCWP